MGKFYEDSKVKIKIGKQLKGSNWLFCLTALLYKIVLDYVYVITIVPRFGYWGYFNNWTFSLELISWVVFFVLLIPINNLNKIPMKISDEVLFVLFVFSITPFTTLIKYGHFNGYYILLNSSFWIVLFLTHYALKYSKRSIKIMLSVVNPIRFNDKFLELVSVLFLLIVVYISGYYSGFRIDLGISNALEMREEALAYNLPALLLYPYLWSQVIVPVLLAYFLQKKDYIYVLLSIATQLLSYSINGMKTTLFVTVLIVILFFIPKFKAQKINVLMIGIIICACVLGIIEYELKGTAFISGVILFRIMFLPNSISYYYYDFFSTHIPDFFRASFLRHFGFQTPYYDLPQIIGQKYFYSNMRCNDGLSGDAFANFGVIGVIILPILIAYVLSLMDDYTSGLDIRMYLGCAFLLGIRLMSTYLITNLLSYGFIILILIFKLIRRKTDCIMVSKLNV